MKLAFNKVKNLIKKYKVIVIILLIILILTTIFLVMFSIKGYDLINIRTITYKRNNICENVEYSQSYTKNFNLYNIINTNEYKEKNWIINSYDINKITLKTFKNSPTKEGKATIEVIDCEDKTTRTLSGRYKKYNKNYIVVYLENEVFLYYFDKKSNNLIDYYNYVKNNDVKYIKNK